MATDRHHHNNIHTYSHDTKCHCATPPGPVWFLMPHTRMRKSERDRQRRKATLADGTAVGQKYDRNMDELAILFQSVVFLIGQRKEHIRRQQRKENRRFFVRHV